MRQSLTRLDDLRLKPVHTLFQARVFTLETRT